MSPRETGGPILEEMGLDREERKKELQSILAEKSMCEFPIREIEKVIAKAREEGIELDFSDPMVKSGLDMVLRMKLSRGLAEEAEGLVDFAKNKGISFDFSDPKIRLALSAGGRRPANKFREFLYGMGVDLKKLKPQKTPAVKPRGTSKSR